MRWPHVTVPTRDERKDVIAAEVIEALAAHLAQTPVDAPDGAQP